jgi:hypothetical protein
MAGWVARAIAKAVIRNWHLGHDKAYLLWVIGLP